MKLRPILTAAMALLFATPSFAQNYPTRAIRIVVPFPA